MPEVNTYRFEYKRKKTEYWNERYRTEKMIENDDQAGPSDSEDGERSKKGGGLSE